MKKFLSLIISAAVCVLALVGCASANYRVYQFDNGDDYFCEGLRRIVDKSGKIGFVDEDGKVVIKPAYAFAFPFEDGRAKVTFSGHLEADGEYHRWVSSDWFYINSSGERLPAD